MRNLTLASDPAVWSPFANDHIDEFYYLLQDLGTVAGLTTKNGTLAEAYTYDAYGQVSIWQYVWLDYNRSGGSDNDDYTEWATFYPQSGVTEPPADVNGDDLVDLLDFGYLGDPIMGGNSHVGSAVPLLTSGVGNSYFFTGRRLNFFEDLTDSGSAPVASRHSSIPLGDYDIATRDVH